MSSGRLLRAAVLLLLAFITVSRALGAAPNDPDGLRIPPLIVGDPPPRSFIVDGIARGSKNSGIAFRVAVDGKKQITVFYDPVDGTPIFISDGNQTLTYDLLGSRIVFLPAGWGVISLDWSAQEGNLHFRSEVLVLKDRVELNRDQRPPTSFFRVDSIVAAQPMQRLTDDAHLVRYAHTNDHGRTDMLINDSQDISWFRFTSADKGERFYRFVVDAWNIDQRLPPSVFTFPDVKVLAANMRVEEFKEDAARQLLSKAPEGVGWVAKVGLCGGSKARAMAEKTIPAADWRELARRDQKLGTEYRSALSKAGYECAPYRPDARASKTK